jgi:glycosyltransferase involved in cell wall biosynthesis
LKILTISSHDNVGGAARAAYNLYRGLQDSDLDSRMLVSNKSSSDHNIDGPKTKLGKLISMLAPYMDSLPRNLYQSSNMNLHSTAWYSNIKHKKINTYNANIVHLHWVQAGAISVKTISKIKGPIVWTLHDMWAFSGAEHYSDGSLRYKEGYLKNNREKDEFGCDINRWVWERKLKAYRSLNNLTIVTPSKWMGQCASESQLLKGRRVEVIPVGVDHTLFCPRDKKVVREILGMPLNKNIILIGAMNFLNDKRKGGQLLKKALKSFCQSGFHKNTELYIFGISAPKDDEDFGLKTHYFGAGRDDLSLALLYSAVDVFVAPSIEENFAATVFESLSCGIPVVAYNIGGMPDMISHRNNGYLAEPFDTDDLANGIEWILTDAPQKELSKNARQYIERECTMEIQVSRYKSLYESILKDS